MKGEWLRGGIRRQLTITFVGLSVVPLVLMGALFTQQSFITLERQSVALQEEAAGHAVSLLKGFFRDLENDMRLTCDVQGFRDLPPARQRALLARLLAYEHTFDELTLMDARGTERVRVSRLRFIPEGTASRAAAEEFRVPRFTSRVYYGPVTTQELTGEPTMILSVPLRDVRREEPVGVLAALVRLKTIWNLVGGMPSKAGQVLYVLDTTGSVVAHPDPSVVLRGTRFTAPARNGLGRGLAGTSAVMAVDSLRAGEQAFTVVSEQDTASAFSLGFSAVRIALILTLAALALSFICGILIVRSLVTPLQEMAATARTISSGDLSRRVTLMRRDELGVLAEAFNSMAAQLKNLFDGLEQRVAERTAQLEASNRELEAFSYSVSHDLRAPLRAMNGFARILLEEDGRRLPPESARRLRLITENGSQMNQLIDALLSFSRTGRQPLARRPVDMAALVREVIDGLRTDLEGRRVSFLVGEIPACECDPLLMKQVWVNLLSNAVKFTAKREEARIEAGSLPEEEGRRTYYVRDNGVGFDMSYAAKLFGVFQRLHAQEEFDGNGIGLAITQRIVSRHGGRIWAQAQVDVGATFFFQI